MRRSRAMSLKRYPRLLSCALALASLPWWQCAFAAGHSGARASSLSYDIGSGSLDDVLSRFIDQSSVQLLYSPNLVRGKRSTGLKGRYAPAQALARLLSEQSLTAVAVTPNTYLLQPVPARARRERGSDDAPARSAPAQDPGAATQLAAVTVVGSRIPRAAFDSSFPVNVITSEEIESSGVGTLYELLREQPGMLGHHPVAVVSEGVESLQPVVTAASASLYSLGPRGTLFLVDGRRVANFGLVPSDLGGLFDLNSIPLSFIDHIEILRGAASANYGADAAAGAVNIILKKDAQGGELVGRYGLSDRGDARISGTSASYGAHTRAGGSFFVGADVLAREALDGDARRWHTADQRRFGLGDGRVPLGFVLPQFWLPTVPFPQCRSVGKDPGSPYCKFDTAKHRTLQPRIHARSAYAQWQQPLGDSVSLEASARFSRVEQILKEPPELERIYSSQGEGPQVLVPDDLPGAYSPNDIMFVFYDVGPPQNKATSRTVDLAVGVNGTAGEWDWKLDLSRSAQRTGSVISGLLTSSALRPATLREYRVFGNNDPALLDSMTAAIRPGGRDTLDSFEASLQGPLLRLPSGAVQFSAGLALRKERLIHVPDPMQSQFGLSDGGSDVVARDITGHSAAGFAEFRVPASRTLQFDLATHLERDNRFSAQLSSRIGLAWAPSERIRLRASLGRSRRTPSLQEWGNPYDGRSMPLLMYTRPSLVPCTEYRPGYCLVEVGAGGNPDLRPESSRNASIGITLAPTDAFDLRLEHYRIKRWDEFGLSNTIEYPQLHPQGLIRDADGVLYRIAEHLANTGRSQSRGWDAAANYRLRTESWGTFQFQLVGHYLEQHVASTIYSSDRIDDAGYNAPKLSATGSVKWRYGDWTTTLAMRHFGRSRAYYPFKGVVCWSGLRAAGKCSNPSATLLGLNLNYTGLDRWAFSLNINNLTDRQPVNYRPDRDGYNIAVDDPYGRYYVLTTTYRF